MGSLASSLLEFYPTIRFDGTHLHLIEAMGRIMPGVPGVPGVPVPVPVPAPFPIPKFTGVRQG